MQKRVLRGLLLLAGLAGMLSGCQYAEIASVGLDESRPGLVGPMLCDTLSVSEMVERAGESTRVFYRESDGVAYITNADTVKVPKASHIALRNTTSGSRTFNFTGVTPTSSTGAKIALTMEFVRPANLRKARFKAKKFDLVLSCSSLPEGATSVTGSVGIAGLPSEVQFEVGPRRVITLSLLGIKGDETPLSIPNGGGYDRNQLLLDFRNIRVRGTGSGEVYMAARVVAEGVEMEEAYGQSLLGSERIVGQQGGLSSEIFSTTVLADQSVPDVFFELEIQKSASMAMGLGVEDLRAHNLLNKDFQPDGRKVVNKLPLGDNGLDLSVVDPTTNPIPRGVTSKIYRLDSKNSNIGELFGRGANRLSFGSIKLLPLGYSSSKDTILDIHPDTVRVIKRCGMSMDGWVKSNLMRSRMSVDVDFLGGGFIEADQKGVHAEKMQLDFVIANRIPLDVYASMTFEDKDGKPLFTMHFDENKLAPGLPSGMKMGLFVPAAEVSNGVATGERTAHVSIPLTREEYERVAQNARYLRTEYLFRSAGAGQMQRVALRKDDYLRVNVGMRIDGRVDRLK